MDGKTILAFALMIGIYFFFFSPDPRSVAPTANAVKEEKITNPKEDVRPTLQNPKSDLLAKRVRLANQDIEVILDGTGAIRAVKILEYKQKLGNEDPVEFKFSEGYGLGSVSLSVNKEPILWTEIVESKNSLTIKGSTQSVNILREISLASEGYLLKATDKIVNQSDKTISVEGFNQTTALPIIGKGDTPVWAFFAPPTETEQFVSYVDGSTKREDLKSIKSHILENPEWSGVAYKYFLLSYVPTNFSLTTADFKKFDDRVESLVTYSPKQLESGKSSSYEGFIYLGPKELKKLKEVHPTLYHAIEFGDWIGPIAVFLLGILNFFFSVIPNYGIAIILLTLLVKLVLFPLMFKSSVSMRKLALVQPKMKEIKDRYSKDKQKMQMEMMNLYRTEKVNPVGGCLPMLLQMPVFFALYRVFSSSIELRHAPFFGWIQDLTHYDSYLITPILMTALMYYQQKITPMPSSMDDNEAVRVQKAMMKWMPVMFGFFMLFLPSGLTLYFLVNSLLSIIQQILLNKHLDRLYPLPINQPVTK